MPLYATAARQDHAARAVDRVWLLDLEWSGRIYRLSSVPIVLTDDTGVDRQYTGGVLSDPSVSRTTNRSGVDDAAASAPLELAIDSADIASRIAGGSRLQEARGWLYEVHTDKDGAVIQTWSQRIAHVVNGRATNPVFDDPDSPVSAVSFTLEEQPADEATPLIEPTAVVDATTWPDIEGDASDGKVYPLVVGSPGVFRLADGADGITSGSPAYAITYQGNRVEKILVAGHVVIADQVRVFDSNGGAETFTVQAATDGRGRLISFCNIHSAGSLDTTIGTTYYVRWPDGGGLESPFKPGEAITGAGDLLRWFGLLSGADVDLSAFAAEAGYLNRFKISGFYNDAEQLTYEAITELIDYLPGVGIRRDSNGLRPTVRRLDYPDAGCAGTIYGRYTDPVTLAPKASPDFSPLDAWTYQTSEQDLTNAVTVSFAKRVKTGRYRRRLTVTPAPESGQQDQTATSYATFGESRSQRIQARNVEIPIVYDEVTAGIIAADTVRQEAFTYRTRSYFAGFRFGWLKVNEQYLLTDDVYTDVQVECIGKEPTPGGYVITLALDDDPVRLAPKTV